MLTVDLEENPLGWNTTSELEDLIEYLKWEELVDVEKLAPVTAELSDLLKLLETYREDVLNKVERLSDTIHRVENFRNDKCSEDGVLQTYSDVTKED